LPFPGGTRAKANIGFPLRLNTIIRRGNRSLYKLPNGPCAQDNFPRQLLQITPCLRTAWTMMDSSALVLHYFCSVLFFPI
jgi:hypothetical protein